MQARNASRNSGRERPAQSSTRLCSGHCVLAALFLSPAARAQDSGDETKGIDSGDYNIQHSIEFGYRANEINGNKNTYDTFVNLGSGVRLFDYTLDMRSLDHKGLFFDNLSFRTSAMAAIRTMCRACASKKTNGTTSTCSSAATRTSGTTISWPIR